jgi:hypothetical protein
MLDMICTQGTRRDCIWSFVDYFPKFVLYWTGITVVWHFAIAGKSVHHLAWKQVYG